MDECRIFPLKIYLGRTNSSDTSKKLGNVCYVKPSKPSMKIIHVLLVIFWNLYSFLSWALRKSSGHSNFTLLFIYLQRNPNIRPYVHTCSESCECAQIPDQYEFYLIQVPKKLYSISQMGLGQPRSDRTAFRVVCVALIHAIAISLIYASNKWKLLI